VTGLSGRILLAAMVFWVASESRAWGDVFLLNQGGQVVGDLQNGDQSPRETYVVKTSEGVTVTLARSQVKQWLRPRPEDVEYENVRSRYPDTPDGQWELAEWCKERKLLAQRKAHLQRVIALDSDHEAARRALGYTKVEGKWTTQREVMTKQGYRWYKDRWRTQQEIDILEEKGKANVVEKDWMQKVDRWSVWLLTERAEDARQNLLAIKDPTAVKALAYGLKRNQYPQVRVILAQALAGLGTIEAQRALAFNAIEDGVEDVRAACLELLKKRHDPSIVDYFVSRLQPKKSTNVMVNRAGAALKAMNEPSTVVPLIDALVTVHRFRVSSGNPGQMSTTFGSGGSGLAMGGGSKIVPREFQNPDVLDALSSITGQAGLGYNVPAWRAWYAAHRNRETVDVRRDK